ncbi:MAG TPA: hypothetical protein VFN55_10090 [Solirubrobacteraceae bacterium]|nr:hypothetical protein [Solirubrobacteraceae bacterium]
MSAARAETGGVLTGALISAAFAVAWAMSGASGLSSPAAAVKIVALFGGGAVLHATGETAYTIAWFALIVGAHLLAFGRAFWASFYIVGAVLIAAAGAGTVTGLAGGSAALRPTRQLPAYDA